METIEIIKLVGAIVLGYAILLFIMWLFKKGNKSQEAKSKKK